MSTADILQENHRSVKPPEVHQCRPGIWWTDQAGQWQQVSCTRVGCGFRRVFIFAEDLGREPASVPQVERAVGRVCKRGHQVYEGARRCPTCNRANWAAYRSTHLERCREKSRESRRRYYAERRAWRMAGGARA